MTKKAGPKLKGKLVFLRRPEPEDEAEFLAKARQSRGFHRGLMRLALTHDEYIRYVDRQNSEVTKGFFICGNSGESIVGVINLSQIFHGPLKSAYLGYGLFADFTGCGYATDAVRLMARYAFDELKLHRIEANIQPENTPSIRLVERLGFAKEGFSPKYLKINGRWRDHERWALIRENWNKKL
jgi:[ribosomal protein S5]-alanine N-acetyltransferase